MFAIRNVKELGWCNLWLECDSTWVVNLFQTCSTNVPWVVRLQWDYCLYDFGGMNFIVSHIYREGNGVADRLAKF